MKKELLFLMTGLFLSTSCSSDFLSEEPEVPEVQGEMQGVERICATLPEFNSYTRTVITSKLEGVKYAWAEKDTIGIFPDEGFQVPFSMKAGAGTNSAVFTGGGWGLKPSATYMAYYPSVGQYYLDKTRIPVHFDGQVQVGNNSTAHLGAFDYLVAPASEVKDGSVSFNFERMGVLLKLDITVPEPGTLTKLTLSCGGWGFFVKGNLNLPKKRLTGGAGGFSQDISMELKDLKTTREYEVVTLYMMVSPTDLKGLPLWISIEEDGVTKKTSVVAKDMKRGGAYAYAATLNSCRSYEVKVPGTLREVIGNEMKTKLTDLKLTGELNGSDIRFLREMCALEGAVEEQGSLNSLDLSEARIVEGGDAYDSRQGFRTENDVIGKDMFAFAPLTQVVLPKTCRQIMDGAFYSCQKLKTVEIPESVEVLENAFGACSQLSRFTGKFAADQGRVLMDNGTLVSYAHGYESDSYQMTNEVVRLEKGVFLGSVRLRKVILSDQLTEIPDKCFKECVRLNAVDLHEGITRIGLEAFSSCVSIKELRLPQSLEEIGVNAFGYCEGLEELTIPENVKSVNPWFCFNQRNFKLLNIKARVKKISFMGFMAVERLYLPETTEVVSAMVLGNELKELRIFATVPPQLQDGYEGMKLNCKVMVPHGCLDIYRNNPQWKAMFADFEEMPAGTVQE